MHPTPPDWPRISTALTYQDPGRAIDWLCEAFGFALRMKVEGDGGEIVHSELEYGEGLVMVGGERAWTGMPDHRFATSPRSLDGANTQSLMVYVDDVEAHFAQAEAAGATVLKRPETTDYGAEHWSDRGYAVRDLEGHVWYFAQRLRNPPGP